LENLSQIGFSVAYTLEEICKKSCNEPKTVVTLHHQNIDQASKELNAIQAISSGRCFERSSIRQKKR